MTPDQLARAVETWAQLCALESLRKRIEFGGDFLLAAVGENLSADVQRGIRVLVLNDLSSQIQAAQSDFDAL